ncbi:MAG TPA: cbb3-type cytochrome c oxidase subunit 3 [Chlorobaculum parvum]|uniref:Cbb3-type cytochrome c oxidase subunit 3 n=1 Tax=Chlorobaculum parvum TaxID=274539 RepID=A0A7C5HSJ9_9CHLB|nr:cbb3-type cytochrome c oxidase subunit 3 [Chlorobaculum parvum]
MNWEQIAYVAFTITLVLVMAGIIIYYYNPKRKKKVEEPKFRMLDKGEDEQGHL